jgi:hypothetical protein
MNANTLFRMMILAAALAAGIGTAQAANTAGCTPQEKSAQTLSQKVDKTQGTICPPDVTPAAPASPAAIPGGGGSVRPK